MFGRNISAQAESYIKREKFSSGVIDTCNSKDVSLQMLHHNIHKMSQSNLLIQLLMVLPCMAFATESLDFSSFEFRASQNVVFTPSADEHVITGSTAGKRFVAPQHLVWISKPEGEIDFFAQPEPEEATQRFFVRFPFDSAALTKTAKSALFPLSRQIRAGEISQVSLTGHADAIGSDLYNINLSGKRAETVASWLEKQGLAAEQIDKSAKGKSEPVASNKTVQGRAKNRRVVIEVTE